MLDFDNWNFGAPDRKASGQDKKDKVWSGEGKRTDDRASGTGRNTHNKHEKKGGAGGKGNWGTTDVNAQEEPT